MKIFRVNKDVVINPEREFVVDPELVRIPVVKLGEHKHLALKGMHLLNDQSKDIYVTQVNLKRKKGKYLFTVSRFTESSEVNRKVQSEEEILIIIDSPYRYKGKSKVYVSKDKVVMRDTTVRNGVKLENLLVKVTPEDLPIYMEVKEGKTYFNEEDTFVIFIKDKRLSVLPESEFLREIEND